MMSLFQCSFLLCELKLCHLSLVSWWICYDELKLNVLLVAFLLCQPLSTTSVPNPTCSTVLLSPSLVYWQYVFTSGLCIYPDGVFSIMCTYIHMFMYSFYFLLSPQTWSSCVDLLSPDLAVTVSFFWLHEYKVFALRNTKIQGVTTDPIYEICFG